MDYSTLKKKNGDGFILHLTQILNNYVGKEYSAFLSANIVPFGGKDICRIQVLPSNKPVYVVRDGQEEFFLRALASTQPMQMKEAHEYIKMHWRV